MAFKVENKNFFSVSMSVYSGDSSSSVKEAIASIIEQSLPPSEIILVVDGPVSNEIISVIATYENTYSIMKVIWLDKNVGHGKARRIGLENCKYELVALMDSDDIARSDRFQKQVAVIEANTDVSVVGGQIEEFDNDTGLKVGVRQVPYLDCDIKKYLKKRCPMNQMTVMFRKSHVMQAGGYLDWHYNEDYYLWIRMAIQGYVFHNMEDTLVDVRVNDDMYGRRGGLKYFLSEARLQRFMLEAKLISILGFLSNVSIRFVVQVLLPNKIRKILFLRFFRD
jgi:glycosyltransferase involved in cell wall biosynthesis